MDGRFRAIAIRSEPKQQPPYRPLAEVIKTQQVVHTLEDVEGSLIGFRFPAAASSVNVPGWHFHFLSADRTRGGHVLGLTTGAGTAFLEEFSDLRIRFPARAPRSERGRGRDQGGRTRALDARSGAAFAQDRARRRRPGRGIRRPFASHRNFGSAAIPLLSAIARLDISSPREQGVRVSHGVAMSPQKNGG
ncbi:MAG TPA: acetolactate decarboxylase, partial [Casimicrobiaceae bacterium]